MGWGGRVRSTNSPLWPTYEYPLIRFHRVYKEKSPMRRGLSSSSLSLYNPPLLPPSSPTNLTVGGPMPASPARVYCAGRRFWRACSGARIFPPSGSPSDPFPAITRWKKDNSSSTRDLHIDSLSLSSTWDSNWKLTGMKEALSISLATFEKPLKNLTFADLLEATNDFHNDRLIGSGGFGDVYIAQLKDGSVVAIKKLIHISGQGEREFMAEIETIGKIKHRNVVPLLGYSKVKEERFLVYEYKHGSLEDVLHDRKKNGIKLNWAA